MAILGFRMAGVTLTDSGVGLFIAVLRPSAPVVVQRIAGEEGRLIRRALGTQTADCAGLVIDRLFRAGGGGFQVLCIHGLRREVVGQLFAILRLAYLADGFCGAGRRAAGAVISLGVRGIALAGAGMGAVFVGRPIAPVVVQRIAGEEGCLIRRALGAQTADCAGLVIDRLFGTGCSRLQILRLCFFSSEAVCRHLAVFAAADRAYSLGDAGRRAAVAILGFCMAGVTLTDSGVGIFIAVLRPSAPIVPKRFGRSAANRACPSACASRRSAPFVCLPVIPCIITHRACNIALVPFIIYVLRSHLYCLYLAAFSTKPNIRRICRHRHNSQHQAQYEHNAQNFFIHIFSPPLTA